MGLYDQSTAMQIKKRHDSARERGRKEASEPQFDVHGKFMNRYEMMSLLVDQVASGVGSLPELCENEGYPTLKEVRGWYKHHPDFEREMKEAEACLGAIRGEESIRVVANKEGKALDKDEVPGAKLLSETLLKSAARLNPEYQDKQVIKNETELDRMTIDQMVDRLNALMESNPELKGFLAAPAIKDADVSGVVNIGREE
jgi:hypothetical protein